jgi:PAS domain S-box-containing protein
VAAWLSAIMLAQRDGNDTLLRAQRDTSNLTRIIAEQTARVISGTDRILNYIAFDVHRFGTHSPNLRDVMKNATEGSELLLQLSYTDASGDLIQTSIDGSPARINLADREHFRVHREGKVEGLFISRPVFGRASGKWSIQLSRRIDAPEGGFGGMVVASLDPFYFSRTFDDINVGQSGAITILGRDGILRARSVMDETIIGQDLSHSPEYAVMMSGPDGFLRSASQIDGVVRLLGYRSVPGYPLFVLAGFAEAEFMAETWARQQVYFISAGAATAMLAVMAMLVTWQSRSQVRAHLALNDTAGRLHSSEQRLRDIVETASDWFWEMDADLRFTRFSGSFAGFISDQGSIVGRRRNEIAVREPGDNDAWEQHLRCLADRQTFRNFEYDIRRTDGEIRTLSVSGKPVFDEAGHFLGYRGSDADITERRRAERSLLASEQRYRAMFKAVGQPIVTTDQQGIVVGFNPAAEKLFGYAEYEVVGRDVAMLMPKMHAGHHPAFVASYRVSGRSAPLDTPREIGVRDRDGNEIPAEIALSSWRAGGQEHFIGIIRDLTAAKQIESALRRARDSAEHASRMKSEFLATISHEIRTPMNGVLGTLALLIGDALSPEQKRLADIAHQSAEGLLRLLDDILDFSKLEAGKISIEEADCDPARLVEAVIQVLQPRAEEKGLDLVCRMEPSVPEVVVTDPARLRQILFNLIGNAIKFTPSGQVRVRARRGDDLEDSRFLLEFEIEDTGIGIPAEALDHLFDRFTQADSSITRRFGGTGLGLAICRELCGLLGGDITVSSTPGRGSVFRFRVACAPGDISVLQAEAARAQDITPVALPPLRVLAVDDNLVNRDIVRSILERDGHTVMVAADGWEAVQLAGSHEFDVVLMDVQMPEMDGFTATRHIRMLPGPRHTVPVIALTAHASGSSRPECVLAGMNGFVTKPLRPHALFTEIAAVLKTEMAEPQNPASPAPDGDGLLDRDQIDAMVEAIGPEGWQEAIQGFDAAALMEIGLVLAALEGEQDYRRAAHSLKGIAWNVGAVKLGNLALAIERAETREEAGKLARDLGGVLKVTVAALGMAETDEALPVG